MARGLPDDAAEPRHLPARRTAIPLPTTPEEVARVLKLANDHRTPVLIWGLSTTFVGPGIHKETFLMALDLMDEIIEVDFKHKVVAVEPGAVWHAVDVELAKVGWELAVPGPGCVFCRVPVPPPGLLVKRSNIEEQRV